MTQSSGLFAAGWSVARWFAAPLLGMALNGAALGAVGQTLISDIRLEGLQRISAGTIFNYLPLKAGEPIDEATAAEAIRALFNTGFFRDVRLDLDGDVLVVSLLERPAISSIEISGNKDIDSEQLLGALKQLGLAEGRVFNRSLLDVTEQELQRQYFNRGKYGVKIDSTITPLERNRVGIAIEVDEGEAARIREITLVGNSVFDSETLLDEFELTTGNWLSWITDDNQYSREKLTADLERLRSFYLDRGYINFDIRSTQVTITPDKRDIHISVSLAEGEPYHLRDVRLAGNLIVPELELIPLITTRSGALFSRAEVTRSTSNLSGRLGDDGYAFANINAVPEPDNEKHEVDLTYFIDPGKRTYVRRIEMVDNSKTRDEVMRREMRQMEGAWISTSAVNRSRDRLDMLGYFDSVNVETQPVPGSSDQVDIKFGVREKPSGNLMAGVGYSSGSGIIFSTSVTQDNFLGSGKRIGFSFNNSEVNTVYSISYLNPYYTIDGVSRGFSLYSRETDAEEANISRYVLDSLGGSVNWGIPINEYDRVRLSLGVDRKSMTVGSTPSDELNDWISRYGNDFDGVTSGISWSHDTRNSTLFADRGVYLSASANMTWGDMDYYEARLRAQRYFTISDDWALMGNIEYQFGDGIGDSVYPFYEYLLAGGVTSVRGYRENTLGPRDSNGDAIGGDRKIIFNTELLLPPLFDSKEKNFRVAAFIDGGAIYGVGHDLSSDSFRYSSGLTATWLSPFGPLTFVLAKPLNKKDGDDTQTFQFTIGRVF